MSAPPLKRESPPRERGVRRANNFAGYRSAGAEHLDNSPPRASAQVRYLEREFGLSRPVARVVAENVWPGGAA